MAHKKLFWENLEAKWHLPAFNSLIVAVKGFHASNHVLRRRMDANYLYTIKFSKIKLKNIDKSKVIMHQCKIRFKTRYIDHKTPLLL